MKYYRANRDAYDYFNKRALIKGELCTVSERNKFFRYLSDVCFDTVSVNKNETHIFFGCRYPNKNAEVIVHKQFACL